MLACQHHVRCIALVWRRKGAAAEADVQAGAHGRDTGTETGRDKETETGGGSCWLLMGLSDLDENGSEVLLRSPSPSLSLPHTLPHASFFTSPFHLLSAAATSDTACPVTAPILSRTSGHPLTRMRASAGVRKRYQETRRRGVGPSPSKSRQGGLWELVDGAKKGKSGSSCGGGGCNSCRSSSDSSSE